MSDNKLKYVLLSLIIHGALLLFLQGSEESIRIQHFYFDTIEQEKHVEKNTNSSTMNAETTLGNEKGANNFRQLIQANENGFGGDAIVSENDEGGDFSSVNSQKWVQKLPVDFVASLKPFLTVLAENISAKVHYEQELSQDFIMGQVAVDLETTEWGILKTMSLISTHTNSKLNGMVLKQIKDALKDPLPIRASVNLVKAVVVIEFQLTHTSDSSVSDPISIYGNIIKINRIERWGGKYDITSHSWEDNIFTRLFGKKKPSSRELWDLNVKTRNLARACEIERVDVVCIEAAQNYEILGQIQDSKKLYEAACELNVLTACDRLKNKKFH